MTVDLQHLIDRVPEPVLGICRRLRDKGKRGWIVGGCVRDLFRGGDAKDWDIATDAHPDEVVRMFRKVIPTGIQHGTVTVVERGVHYEVTTLRGEGAYSDGRRPDKVEFVDDITADLARRDFTCNAMAIDPVDGHLIDPFEGRKDLEAHVLRAVGDPLERFAEDGLRVLRAARFSATLECVIAPETERAMAAPRSLDTFRKVSAERIRDEWLKAMRAKKPSVAFEAMRRTELLGITCPELIESVGCAQNKWHAYDVWGHAMACLDACKPEPILRVAALLHDVGKPRSRAFSDKTQDYTFYEHERIGAEIAEPILARLRFSNEERARVVGLVRHHLICYAPDWTDAAVRRWLRRVTPELAPDLYDIGVADALGKGRDAREDVDRVLELRTRVEAVLASGAALSARDLAINGKDIMSELGLPPGRAIGVILEHLVERVTDDPAENERDRLLAAARQIAAELSSAADALNPTPHKTDPISLKAGPVKILFLGANPSNLTERALGRELREIDERLRAAELGDRFKLEVASAVRISDLQQCLLMHKPTIVHFSGHGSAEGQIILEDRQGRAFPVNPNALATTFKILRDNIRFVVLNAAASKEQAQAIAQHIDCVVRMTKAVGDAPAITFSGALYQGLGFGRSVQEAFELGCNQLDMEALAEADVPELTCREGVRAEDVVLVSPG